MKCNEFLTWLQIEYETPDWAEVAVIDWLAIGNGVSKELFTQLLLAVMDREALRKFVSW